MDTKSSQSERLTLALTSGAGDLDSTSVDWACLALGPIPNQSLCFQTSVLTLLAHKPSGLGILELQSRTLPPHQKENMLYGAAPKPQIRVNLHGPR